MPLWKKEAGESGDVGSESNPRGHLRVAQNTYPYMRIPFYKYFIIMLWDNPRPKTSPPPLLQKSKIPKISLAGIRH